MAASTITRDTWTNDTGSAATPAGDGTVLNNNVLQNNIYARIDEMFAGAGSYATLTLGGKLAVEGFGVHAVSAGGTGANALRVTNTSAGTGNRAELGAVADVAGLYAQSFASTYTTSGDAVANGQRLYADGAGGLSISAAHASGVIRFYSGGATLRWGVNAAGDWTFGASSHIADSNGTPTCGSGCSSLVGTDYAFQVTGTGSHTGLTVNFGHTFTSAPICVAVFKSGATADGVTSVEPTTTKVDIQYGGSTSGEVLQVLCRGY